MLQQYLTFDVASAQICARDRRISSAKRSCNKEEIVDIEKKLDELWEWEQKGDRSVRLKP